MQQTMNKDGEGYDDNMTDHDDGWDDTEEWLGEDPTILGKDALLPFQLVIYYTVNTSNMECFLLGFYSGKFCLWRK